MFPKARYLLNKSTIFLYLLLIYVKLILLRVLRFATEDIEVRSALNYEAPFLGAHQHDKNAGKPRCAGTTSLEQNSKLACSS